ncbi:MAG: tetratricopeptide repeat protein [Anaerolineales bacterium]
MRSSNPLPKKPRPNRTAPPDVNWDEKLVKALLGLRRSPIQMLQEEPWHIWLKERGGLNRVIATLRAAPLSPNQKQLLEIILASPNASSDFYARKLHISRSPYFERLSDLVNALCVLLNDWKLNHPYSRRTSAPTSLPSTLTSLVGAEKSVAAVLVLLRRPGARLLTLMGPGGVGKTRLAIAVGSRLLEDFHNGVFFISLETLNDPALIVTQIARSLNVETVGTQPLPDALKAYLRDRQILLILDNFEQLVEGGPFVTDLLQAAPHLKVLVTSREALNVYGESRFTVPELTRPDPDDLPPLEQLSRWPAVDLFVQRVQTRHPGFALTESNQQAIIGICNRLDGLPLAIELAAAQVKFPSPDLTLPPVERGLKALRDVSRDRPPRQRTLWDAIDWSYRLLPEAEQALFRRLAVFGREWGLEAAQTVCETDEAQAGLESLVDKSLLRYAPPGVDGALRFQMLQAVREYALDQLAASAETKQTQRRHAAWCLELAQRAEPSIATPEQPLWTSRIDQERENLQLALQWMLDNEETEMAFNLLGAVWRFYLILNIWSETWLWMDRALAQGAHLKSAGRAKTLWGASWLAGNQGHYERAMSLAEEGLALARQIGDKRLTGLLLQNVSSGLARIGEHDQAMRLLQESLLIFQELGDREESAWVLDHMAWVLWRSGERARGLETLQDSLAAFRAMRHQWAIATLLRQLAEMALSNGNNEQAAALLEESLAISRALGVKQYISETLRNLVLLSWQQADFEQVKAMVEEGLTLSQELGDRLGIGWGLNFRGLLALRQSDTAAAQAFFEQARALFEEVGSQGALNYNRECLERLASAGNGAGRAQG